MVGACGGLSLTFPRGPRNFQRRIPQIDDGSLAWRRRTYQFVSQIYGGLKNMGRDVEGKVVAGGVSLLSVRSGNGGREYCGGGCGRGRERLGLRIHPTSVGEGGNV